MDLTEEQEAFEDGLVEYIEGIPLHAFEKRKPQTYEHIAASLGFGHFCFVLDAYLEYITEGNMPEHIKIRQLPNAEHMLRIYYENSCEMFMAKWKEYFESVWLDEEDKSEAKIKYIKFPQSVRNRVDNEITLNSLIKIFKNHPDKKKQLTAVFEQLPGTDITTYCNMMLCPERNMRKVNFIPATFEDALQEAFDRISRINY